MSLSRVLGAATRFDAAGRVETDFHVLPALRRGAVEIEGETDSPRQAPPPRLRSAIGEGLPRGACEREVQEPGKVAVPNLASAWIRVGHLVHGDEIPASQLDPVDADLLGGELHQSLDQVHHFRGSGPPIGFHGGAVGEHPLHPQMRSGDSVDVPQHLRVAVGGGVRPVAGEVGAEVCQRRDAQSENTPLLVQGERCLAPVVARVGVGEECLLAIRHPAHRAAERAGREEHQSLFRVDRELDAESSADVGVQTRRRSESTPSTGSASIERIRCTP